MKTTPSILFSNWDWSPQVIGMLFLGMALYYVLFRKKLPKGSVWFLLGLFVTFVAVDSPLGPLADILFCANMVKHILFLLLIPPLLLIGLPMHGTLGQPSEGKKKGLWITFLLWFAGVGGMWFWHIPYFCDAAALNTNVRTIETLSSFMLGMCFWWPILGPQASRRLEPLGGVLYMFSACIGCTLLGILISFSPDSLYPAYCHPVDPLGVQTWVIGKWGLTTAIDQQIGGLIMWVPTCLVYVSGSMALLFRWYHTSESSNPVWNEKMGGVKPLAGTAPALMEKKA